VLDGAAPATQLDHSVAHRVRIAERHHRHPTLVGRQESQGGRSAPTAPLPEPEDPVAQESHLRRLFAERPVERLGKRYTRPLRSLAEGRIALHGHRNVPCLAKRLPEVNGVPRGRREARGRERMAAVGGVSHQGETAATDSVGLD
jgi:hypothetical protein